MATIGAHIEDGLVVAAVLQPTGREAGGGVADQHPVPDNDELRECARIESSQWWPVDRRPHSDFVASARRTIGTLLEQASSGGPLLSLMASEDREWVLDNTRLLRALWLGADQSRRSISEQPHVQSQAGGRLMARPLVVAGVFLKATGFCFDAEGLAAYLAGWQEEQRLEMGELWALKSSLELGVLQELAGAVQPLLDLPATGLHLVPAPSRTPISRLITALRKIGDEEWQVLFEQMSVVDEILRQDPAHAYAEMDYASRDLYRSVIAELASHSAVDEVEVAQAAVAMAKSAQDRRHTGSRIAERQSHIGYYLLDDGLFDLRSRIGYRAPLGRRLRDLILKFPSTFYLTGIETLTFLIVVLALGGLPPLVSVVASFFFFFIPASQAAVEIMNSLVTSLLPARQLPKLDFSEGIPDQCKTMVAVPSLLLSERQVKDLVEGLEVRYLANREPNLYFALLTDNPDAHQPFDDSDKQEGLVNYCSRLINELNRKYAASREKPFFLFHRHPEFNPSENVWMGWERKRGKLLDLNQLLRGAEDKFPVKVGDLSVLRKIRFVITLDCDTQLPKDTAHRLIGTLAHPLNRAIVDPITNTVVSGYGILQPRVGISVHSASRSRLASLYSGQTGFDIYTRAVSDVYQDLYGEGSFTGKGIYEVDVFHQVLDKRFPRNTLLSHDLIEGAYTRAALVSDIELIDDYPSHFSAYSRRKHRWVRGDWQIMEWLFPRVPDYDGRSVANPITVISRWKIFDNLRRSLIDPGLFFLLIAGWFFLPGRPWYWTLATVLLLLAPLYIQAYLSLLRARNPWQLISTARTACVTLAKGHLNVLLTLAFLAHQALIMIDAIIRTLIRHRITRRRLLQWETAAEAESSKTRKTPVEVCLFWTPWIALGTTLALALRRPEACLYAAPILLLWAGSRTIARWLSVETVHARVKVKAKDEQFLRGAALRAWRYFRENGGSTENWLIPDNVQESPAAAAHRISPTNLGLLLNARQAALGFGYITLPEFVGLTSSTLSSVAKFPKYRGHFFNWYDTWTLAPVDPLFVSTVDSGNLAASLWALKQGCLSRLKEPIFSEQVWQGLLDHVHILREQNRKRTAKLVSIAEECGTDGWKWLTCIDRAEREAQTLLSETSETIRWWAAELVDRLTEVRRLVDALAPWIRLLDPTVVRALIGDPKKCLASLTLEGVPAIATKVRAKLQSRDFAVVSDALGRAVTKSEALQSELRQIAVEAAQLVEEMDFRFLYNRRKKLLSVGYDVSGARLHTACYDLLASEARTAVFVAVAKGDIPQESWLRLDRTQTAYRGRRILLSWTGTMFEYLMPSLWIKTYPRTLLEQSLRAVVEAQQLYCRGQRTPWGISESAYAAMDANGCYQYCAFGLSGVALKRSWRRPHVVAPYASFLALETHPAAAVRNLRHMWKRGWAGKYGFCDAIQFENGQTGRSEAIVVPAWMAHHLAMSLIAVANRLLGSPFQQYFHAEPQVMATELLLHEKVSTGLKVRSKPGPEPATNSLTLEGFPGRVPVPQDTA